MTRKQRRLSLIGIGIGVLALAAGLVLYAMRDTLVFFRMPSEIAEKAVQPGTRFRLGGLVSPGSLERSPNQNVSFAIMDANGSVPVRYHGILPDLFREGQGVVAEGSLNAAGEFMADSVLAKHDETYMPREVADALRKQGVWQGGTGKPDTSKPETGKPASGQPASDLEGSAIKAPINKTSER